MPLQMNRDAFITCAVTGSGDTTGKSDKVPVTPAEIAAAAIDAAIDAVGADSIRDMGKVMGELKGKYTGQMDFGSVGAKVKAKLSS